MNDVGNDVYAVGGIQQHRIPGQNQVKGTFAVRYVMVEILVQKRTPGCDGFGQDGLRVFDAFDRLFSSTASVMAHWFGGRGVIGRVARVCRGGGGATAAVRGGRPFLCPLFGRVAIKQRCRQIMQGMARVPRTFRGLDRFLTPVAAQNAQLQRCVEVWQKALVMVLPHHTKTVHFFAGGGTATPCPKHAVKMRTTPVVGAVDTDVPQHFIGDHVKDVAVPPKA